MTTFRCTRILVFFAGLALAGLGGESRADYLIGSTFHVAGLNTPNTFDETVTLAPGTTLIDGGRLSLTQSIVEQGGGLWLNLRFTATQGRLIPNANLNGSFGVSDVQLAAPAYYSARMLYWTIGGEPAPGIAPFYQVTPVLPNPLDPLGRNVYLHYDSPTLPTSVVAQVVSPTPYTAMYSGNIDPTRVDGIVMAFKITAVTPEPAACLSALTGLSITAVVAIGRSRGARAGRGR